MAKTDDEGFNETEEVLDEMENEITESYSTAEKVAATVLGIYIASCSSEVNNIQSAFDNGETTKSEYENSLVNTLATGKTWTTVKNAVANVFTKASQSNKSNVFSYLPSIFSINHNYGTYEVEKSTGIDTGYTLYDKNAVDYLVKGNAFYPSAGVKLTNAINTGKTKAWNKKQIQSAMIQSIKSGEGANKLAKRIAETVGEKNKNSDIRNARTMTTCVQNAGRLTAYERAADMGIQIEKQWRAIHDDRTRHEHRILDLEHVPVSEPFVVGGEKIRFPSDPTAAPHLIYNCRCRLTSYNPKYSNDNNKKNLNSSLGDMTYDEWKYEKNTINKETSQDVVGETYKETLAVEEQTAKFRAGLQNTENENVKRLLTSTDKTVNYGRSKKETSYISYGVNGKSTIYLSPTAEGTSVAHELFHEIDYRNGVTSGGGLTTAIVKDYNKISRNDTITYLRQNYGYIFENDNTIKSKYKRISDIIHGCSGGEVNLGYGHYKKDYWVENSVEKETWAHCGAIYYSSDDDVISLLEELFPTTAGEFLRTIRGL